MVQVKGLGVVAPMLNSSNNYSNYHYDVDDNG